MKKHSLHILMTFFTCLMFSASAVAHTGHLASSGFIDGLLHPFLGMDHVLAMYAVGLWAVLKGGDESMLLPLSFLMAMLVGAGLCFFGVQLPAMEILVILSLLVCAALMLFKVHLSTILSCLLVMILGLGHGFVHAAEINTQAQLVDYVSGFILSSAFLLAMGLLTAFLSESVIYKLRTLLGLTCAFAGMALLIGV